MLDPVTGLRETPVYKYKVKNGFNYYSGAQENNSYAPKSFQRESNGVVIE